MDRSLLRRNCSTQRRRISRRSSGSKPTNPKFATMPAEETVAAPDPKFVATTAPVKKDRLSTIGVCCGVACWRTSRSATGPRFVPFNCPEEPVSSTGSEFALAWLSCEEQLQLGSEPAPQAAQQWAAPANINSRLGKHQQTQDRQDNLILPSKSIWWRWQLLELVPFSYRASAAVEIRSANGILQYVLCL